MSPKFSIVVIAKNEATTLSRLFKSLEEFKSRGGEVCILDTGSTDDTISVAEAWGAKVYVDRSFRRYINRATAEIINKKFAVDDEAPIVIADQVLFDFASARNTINELASNDMICTLDADEAYTVFDIDKINQAIDEGFNQFEYQFVYAHDERGRPAVQFVQSKFFDRTKAKWVGIVHEVVTGATNIKYLDESIIKLEHFQEGGKEHRGGYLPGLALDCHLHPEKDRQSHYFAREMMYAGKFKSAIKEFKRHVEMKRWPSERAQSMIYMAHCYGVLNKPEEQFTWLSKAFYTDPKRRAALVELALFMRHNNSPEGVAAYAGAAMQIPWSDYYANEKAHYEDLPHALMYWARGWMGDIPGAREHILKALWYSPYNTNYLADTKYYFDYPDQGIQGWMTFEELQWLYTESQKHEKIVEVGSWKGRSTHAICSGAEKAGRGAVITAVDTWAGSKDVQDATNWMAKEEDIYKEFRKNTGQFDNLRIIRKPSLEAAKDFEDGSLDLCFIDAGHTKEELQADARAWLPKVKRGGILCGHDYQEDVWMGVVEGVNELFGKPDGVCGSIWWISVQGSELDNKVAIADAIERLVAQMEDRPDKILNPIEFIPEYPIPKHIYTAWLSESIELPNTVFDCIKSQELEGYKHGIISLASVAEMPEVPEYLKKAIAAKKWVKAVDYIRMYTLYKFGGIFLDADVEVIRPFDELLNESLFVGAEVMNPNGTIVLGTAVMGAVAGHPMIKKWMETVEANFQGDDDLYYESSMDVLNKVGVDFQDKMKILPPEYFYPYNHRTGVTEQTDNTICIHKFMKTWTPENLNWHEPRPEEEPGFQYVTGLKDKIVKGENFSFIKLGDGEEMCMSGKHFGEANCDLSTYTPDLALRLQSAFYLFDQNPKAYVLKFNDQKYYNALLHRTDSDLKAVSDFYKVIARSIRKKYFIGPMKLVEMTNILNVTKAIPVREVNGFDEYEKVFSEIPIEEDGIYLFCAGMMAKVLIADLMRINPNATYLDCGSAFDPLAGRSRTFQITREEFLALYTEPDPKKKKHIPWDNLKIPQANHPEKLFVLDNIDHTDLNILDLGCGKNKTLDRAVGMDIRPVTDLQGDIGSLVINKPNSDVIISRHSLEHLEDPAGALANWKRILRPGGKMIIVLPDHGAIDTLDPVLSMGEHKSAWSRETFREWIESDPSLYIHKLETVIPDWSFGAVIYCNLPTVSIIIPHLGREEGLEKCKESIRNLNYPGDNISVVIIDGEKGSVPQKLKKGVEHTKGELIVYAANDMEFTPDSLLEAVKMTNNFALVAFNSGPLLPDLGNICEHFIIRRNFIPEIGGEIFDTRLHHVGVDNLLWYKASKLNQAARAEKAKIIHNHFSKPGGKMDSVYEKGWKNMEADRNKLKEIMASL